jgi:putative Holliday junction resolvase
VEADRLSRLLGIDLGARRIGLATGDAETGATVALATIRRASPAEDAERIARIVREQRVDEIVVGLPLNMDGSVGSQARLTQEWAAAVAPRVAAPLRWRDERLTSERVEAERGRPRRGSSGGPPSPAARTRQRAVIDRHAARLLLDDEIRARRSGAAAAPAGPQP